VPWKDKEGKDKSVRVLDPDIVALLLARRAATKPRQRLFPLSSAAFSYCFRTTCQRLQLSAAYVPHSCRHGGATRLYLQGWSIESILERGRWVSNKSMRTYIQGLRCVFLSLQAPKHVTALGRRFALDVLASFRVVSALSR
jgi:hypothetical protein